MSEIKINLDVNELVRLYTEEFLTVSQIASKYNVNHGTIKLRLTKAGVKFRTHSETQKIAMNRPEVLEKISEASKRSSNKRLQTNLQKYGTAVPSNNKQIKEKWTNECKERFGVNHPSQRPDAIYKRNNTCIKKYGVNNVAKSSDIRDKISNNRWKLKSEDELQDIRNKTVQTWLNNYGVDNPLKSNVVKEKLRNTSLLKYGCNWPSSNPDIIEKIKTSIKATSLRNVINKLHYVDLELVDDFSNVTTNTKIKCKKCGNVFTTILDYVFHGYGMCPTCYPRNVSNVEKEVQEFLSSILTDEIILNSRQVIPPKEIDIYIPNKKVAIEFDGLYWHSESLLSDPKYHLQKTIECEKLGIRLIHIFEDEWVFKKEIVKNRIRQILQLNNNITRIHARQCDIGIIDLKTKNEFLDKFHIQGKDISNIKLGAFHNEELVAVMTFSKGNISKGSKPIEGVWELNRFCTNYNYHVPGVASKLFEFFKKSFEWKEIFSYADRRWSSGNVYHKLGFNFNHNTDPNYWYIKGLIRLHRFNLRKRKDEPRDIPEWVLRQSDGFFRIWDCGNIKFNLINVPIS